MNKLAGNLLARLASFGRGLLLALVVVLGIAAWLALPWFVLLPLLLVLGLWMLLSRRGRQAASVTQVGLSTLPQRIAAS